MLQRRAELQELEEELKRREEVLLHRKACLQQKHTLEVKMLRSSQVGKLQRNEKEVVLVSPTIEIFDITHQTEA